MKNELPPNAKMVFKGKIFEVWQWEQKVYDGTTEIYEKIKRPDTVEVIATVGDKIFIQVQEQPQRSEPFTSLPGGRCEIGEEPLVSIKREFLEETGYSSDRWRLWREEPSPSNTIIWMRYLFVARDCVQKQEPHLDAGEKISNSLVSFDEFLALSQRKDFRNKALAALLAKAESDTKFRDGLHEIIFGN